MNPLRQLQSDVVALLLGNPTTAVIPFSSYRKTVIDEEAAAALAGWQVRVPDKIGVACLVLMPRLRTKYPNMPGPQYEIELTVRTFHDAKVNNTGLECEDVAMSNLAWLDGQQIDPYFLLYGDPRGYALQPNDDFPGFLVYDSVLTSQLPQDALGRTAPVIITDDDAGTVTLACGDAEAAIYFVTDNTSIQPGLADQLYSAPVLVASGTALRALAWNPAKLPSPIAQATINF